MSSQRRQTDTLVYCSWPTFLYTYQAMIWISDSDNGTEGNTRKTGWVLPLPTWNNRVPTKKCKDLARTTEIRRMCQVHTMVSTENNGKKATLISNKPVTWMFFSYTSYAKWPKCKWYKYWLAKLQKSHKSYRKIYGKKKQGKTLKRILMF
jgi:hypothetical protein